MITGIDFLFVAIGLILLLAVVEVWDRYCDWYEFDQEKRLERKRFRYAFQDALAEMNYRLYLRGDQDDQ